MRISKKDALTWFRFFAELPEEEPLGCRQQEIALAVFSQIETAVEARRKKVLRSPAGNRPFRHPEDQQVQPGLPLLL